MFVDEGGGSRKGKEKGKGEKKKRKERKRKRKRERGRRPVVSSLVHWRSDGRNSLDQGVKFGDSTRGHASTGRDSSYFGLFLAFGLILEPCCAMLMAWDGFIAGLKAYFRSEFGLKNCNYGSFQKAPKTLGHAIAWIGAIVWLLVYSNFGRSYLSCPNFNSCALGLYEKLFESRI